MCNLSQGIEENGIAIGKAMGEAAAEAKIIVTMHNNGFTTEQIAAAINRDKEEVETIIEGKELEKVANRIFNKYSGAFEKLAE